MWGWLVGFSFKILGGGVQKQNSVFVPKIIALWKHSPSEFTVSIHNIIKYNMMFFFYNKVSISVKKQGMV